MDAVVIGVTANLNCSVSEELPPKLSISQDSISSMQPSGSESARRGSVLYGTIAQRHLLLNNIEHCQRAWLNVHEHFQGRILRRAGYLQMKP